MALLSGYADCGNHAKNLKNYFRFDSFNRNSVSLQAARGPAMLKYNPLNTRLPAMVLKYIGQTPMANFLIYLGLFKQNAYILIAAEEPLCVCTSLMGAELCSAVN
jgi:hypothetical protein